MTDSWKEIAEQHYRNETYYRGLLIQIGELLGPIAYKSDDGAIHDEPLVAKLPEVVRDLVMLREKLGQKAFNQGFIAGGGTVTDKIPATFGGIEIGTVSIRDRMVVCRKCGNKRCPHATNTNLSCTGSNAPGQPGSAYE